MDIDSTKLSIQLLGPFSAYLEHHPVAPTAAKQRQLLALLALNAGRLVTAATLVEELWGDYPPRSAAATLQTYVLQVRNRLAAAAPDEQFGRQAINTMHSGYMLDAKACQTDVEAFGRLSAEGRAAAESGDARGAADLLASALRLWRGPALVDVPLGRVLELEAAALEETRVGVLERRIQADLALARHADILGELTLLVTRTPMNENFTGLLMIALYRAGHVGRALDAFHHLRAMLLDELGVEPSQRVQRLHHSILSGNETFADEMVFVPTRSLIQNSGGLLRMRPGSLPCPL